MIYFVRHGQTDYNMHKICTGQQDIPLNSVGLEQAKAVGELLKDVKFAACYCSPLIRAKQTCAEILKYHQGLQPIYEARIIERCCGKLENLSRETIQANKWKLEEFQENNDMGVETVQSVLARLTSFYDELKQFGEQNILVVAHGAIGKISHAYFYGFPENNDFSEIKIPNARVIKFNYEEDSV